MVVYATIGLLIVPYGIETPETALPIDTSPLLIVPYGIETPFLYVGISGTYVLLIVPYGIETTVYSGDVTTSTGF